MAKKENWNRQWRELESNAVSTIQALHPLRKTPQSSVNLNNNYYNKIPTWKRLPQVSKMFCLFHFVVDAMNFQAFTLRLSHKFIARSLEKSGDNIPDFIRRRISSNLKNKLGYVPSYLFGIHYDQDDDFHIHGVIRIKTLKEKSKIREALKISAFGKYYKKEKMHKQIAHFRGLFNPLGWLRYIVKYKKYDDMYVSRELNTELRDVYNDIRNKLKALK